ncbi:MAG TPA: hypothetical protein VJ875_10740 [Pyrinomonadaceae bacterium]|nr:hypothetical protein [Pyrinomonadaceae bacterium]
MKDNLTLTITSLLTILFLTFHLSDEITRGMEPGRLNMVIPVLVLGGWVYATLTLSGRRSGYIIMLLGAIIGMGVPIVHMSGVGLVSSRIANSRAAFFWVWQNFTLGVISTCSFAFALRGLWSLRRAKRSLGGA